MKKKKRTYKTTTTTELDYMRVIKISVGVIIVLALVYFLTALGTGEIDLNKKSNTKTDTETVIGYQEIIAGELLNRKASEYYVLVYDFEDEYNSYYNTLINEYTSKDNNLPFYTIDLGKKINELLKASEEETTEFTTLRVSDITLVKVVNGKMSVVAEGKDKVIESLQNI